MAWFSGLWLSRREEQGHPLGLVPPMLALPPAQPSVNAAADASAPRMLVVEVGMEELPPDDVTSAMEQLR